MRFESLKPARGTSCGRLGAVRADAIAHAVMLATSASVGDLMTSVKALAHAAGALLGNLDREGADAVVRAGPQTSAGRASIASLLANADVATVVLWKRGPVDGLQLDQAEAEARRLLTDVSGTMAFVLGGAPAPHVTLLTQPCALCCAAVVAVCGNAMDSPRERAAGSPVRATDARRRGHIDILGGCVQSRRMGHGRYGRTGAGGRRCCRCTGTHRARHRCAARATKSQGQLSAMLPAPPPAALLWARIVYLTNDKTL